MRADAKAAGDLIDYMRRRGETITITPETADELVRMGIKPPGAEVAIPRGDDTLVICPYLVDGEPLILPDNRRALCAECKHPIQHRPHVPKLARLVCSPCGLRMVRGDV